MGSAESVVKDGFRQSSDYAADAWALVQAYTISQAYTAFHSLSFGPVNIELDPALTTEVIPGTLPSVPDFPETPIIEDSFSMPDIPASPVVSLPTEPTLKEYTIPDFSSDIGIPQFTETLPEINLTPIQEIDVKNLFSFLMEGYKPQLSEIKDLLISRVLDGGTGLNADVETAIWNRNLERDQQALQDAVDVVSSQWTKMNFSLPDGLLSGQLALINNEYVNKRLDTSREVAIKQAELEQTNVNAALQLIVQIENAYNSVIVQYAQVGTAAMKTAADVSVELYNTTVQYYNLLIEVYKSKAEVFKTLVNSRLTEAEVYKAKVDGIGKAIDAENSKIQLYLAQISAEDTKLKAYATELQGIIAKIDATKAWLDVGKTRMELFATETRALTEKYNGQIEGYKTLALATNSTNESKVREKDINLREQIAEWDIRLKEYEFLMRDKEQETNVALEKLRTLTGVGAQVVAGALAASHASATIGEQTQTVYSGSV